MDFIVVDIETTGLSANRHKITEIAAVKYKDNKKVDEFSTLVNPECHIPSFITKLTGIDDEMVKDQPTIDKVIPKFKSFIKNYPFIAHNATFDYNFLNFQSSAILNENMENPKICTCMLARRLLPELPTKKLGALCEHYDISNDTAHRAMSDTVATAELFGHFIKILEKKGIKTMEEIEQFQKSKIPKLN